MDAKRGYILDHCKSWVNVTRRCMEVYNGDVERIRVW